MNTKAAVLHQMKLGRPYTDSNPLKIEQLTLDRPGFNEVVVKIKAAGICHSDLSVIDGNRPRPLPMALGHEAAGVVVRLGEGVNKLAIGVHVVFAFLPSCGSCSYCHSGRAALCEWKRLQGRVEGRHGRRGRYPLLQQRRHLRGTVEKQPSGRARKLQLRQGRIYLQRSLGPGVQERHREHHDAQHEGRLQGRVPRRSPCRP